MNAIAVNQFLPKKSCWLKIGNLVNERKNDHQTVIGEAEIQHNQLKNRTLFLFMFCNNDEVKDVLKIHK